MTEGSMWKERITHAGLPALDEGHAVPDVGTEDRPRPERSATTGRILIAVDLGTGSESLVDAALSLARALNLEPFFLYTYDFPPPSPSSFYPSASRAIHEQAMLDLRRLVQGSDPSILEHQLLVRSGSAVRLIVATAHDLPAQMVVMGTHRVGGIERLLVGSTAKEVVRRTACPVLVIPCPFRPGQRPSSADRVARAPAQGSVQPVR